jgi:hypothetical protein
MQRDVLLAANKAQVESSREEIARGLQDVIEAIAGPSEPVKEGQTKPEVDVPATLAKFEVTIAKKAA